MTFAEFDACHRDGGCSHTPRDEGWGRGNRPVIHVSWKDAKEYVGWLSRTTGREYRLLNESEWEYAARAGTDSSYYWGEEPGEGHANCSRCGSDWDSKKTSQAGSFDPNGFGLFDMLGNVWEWVEDCGHRNYEGAPSDGSAWIRRGDCRFRMLRGGSWEDPPSRLRRRFATGSPPVPATTSSGSGSRPRFAESPAPEVSTPKRKRGWPFPPVLGIDLARWRSGHCAPLRVPGHPLAGGGARTITSTPGRRTARAAA